MHTTPRIRRRTRLAVAVACALTLGALASLAPSNAIAAQTGPIADSGVAVWGLSDYLNSGNPGRPAPAAPAYTAPASFDAATKLSSFKGGNVSGTVAANGAATLSFQGASVNWASGTGNGWIRFADPIVTVDGTGTGTVTAEVSYGTTPDASAWTASPATRGPQRITIETLSPDAEVGDAAYPASLSSLAYSFSATSTRFNWNNLIGRWSDDLIAFLATDNGTTGNGWSFKSTVVNNVVNNVVRYPAVLNLSLARSTAAVVPTTTIDQDGIVITLAGTGFKQTAPGIYASLRTRTVGDAAYAGQSLPQDAPTAWVSNSVADIGPDPATGANAAIDANGSFAATIRITKAQAASLDPTGIYTIVTRKGHGQGAIPSNADQISEVPIDLSSAITEARRPTVTLTGPALVAFRTAATYTVAVSAGTGNVVITLAGVRYTRPISAGKATFVLPTTLTAGSRTLKIAYAGDATNAAAAPVSKIITIAKGYTALATSVLRTATAKKPGRVSVLVRSLKGGPTPTGKLTVRLTKGGVTRILAAKTLAGGKVAFGLPKVSRGTWALKVGYGGSTQYLSSVKTRNIVVTR